MDATANKTRVFVVDDDEFILKLLEAVLLKAGFDVQTTSNSETALQAIEDTRPDVVISDLMMPEVDGFALCKGVCESPNLKDTHFIVVSAKAYLSDESRAFELCAEGYIRKPINPDTFADRLH